MVTTHSRLHIARLSREHNRNDFSCGIDSLDNYLKRQATQDMKRFVATTYVLSDGNSSVLGYYSISAYSINITHFPENITNKLPRYPDIPAILLG